MSLFSWLPNLFGMKSPRSWRNRKLRSGRSQSRSNRGGPRLEALEDRLAPTVGWSSASSLATARGYDTATLLGNGKILIAGGFNGSNLSLSSAELYNPNTNTWSSGGSLSTARNESTATLLRNGDVLVAGGYGSYSALSSAELYNPNTNTWSSGGTLASARYLATATLLGNGDVLVVGGNSSGFLFSSAELYNPTTNTWFSGGTLATARCAATATLLGNGDVLVAGGIGNSGPLSSAELYNPTTNTWSSGGSLTTARFYTTSTLLGNGDVPVAGGDDNIPLSSAELYNPTTNTWSSGGTLATARQLATATLLGNGDVLVAGGQNNGGALSSAELYNPTTNMWSSGGTLATARYGDTATLLGNGEVLVAGGDGTSGYLSSAELYNPGIASTVALTAGGASTAIFGQAVTLTATLTPSGSGTPSGSVSFYDNGTLLGNGTLNGVSGNDQASYASSSFVVGSHSFTAVYNGDSNFSSSDVTAAVPLTVAEAPSLVVTTLADVSDPYDGQTSLREAITYAETLAGHHDITFASGVTGVIDLTSALPALTGNISIVGPGANSLTVQRDANAAHFSVFTVSASATAGFSGLTISGGYSDTDGGGIFAQSNSSVTVTNSTMASNSAASFGGGIYADSGSSVTVSNSTLASNYAYSGGGIFATGNVTVTNSTLASNSASYYGGGIYANQSTVTVTDSTLAGNIASYGGGIFAEYTCTVTVTNSTLVSNSASVYGGGIFANPNSTVTVTDSTLASNIATHFGGGIYADSGSSVTVNNSILWGNTATEGGTKINGSATVNSSDVQGGWAGNLNANPLFAALDYYGGPTKNLALLPGSPAIGAGSIAPIPIGITIDQRGFSRLYNGLVDIGAFESRGFTIAVTSGNNQNALVTTAFAQPLVAIVTSAYGEPVAGGTVTFTPPALGASATLTGSPATIAGNGQASVTATANSTLGVNYAVTASANGAISANFTLSNTETPSLVVTTTTDVTNPYDGQTSLREAITYAETLTGHHDITFASGVTGVIDLTSALPALTGNLSIFGAGAASLTVQRDAAAAQFSVFTVGVNATVSFSGLTISGGNSYEGGGIHNLGTLSVSNCTFNSNSASYGGGGIGTEGQLIVNKCTFNNNSASNNYGGGIYDYSANVNVSGSTFTGNSAGAGGGMCITYSTVTVSDSTFAENATILVGGGGISNQGSTLTLTSCTLSGNSAVTYNTQGGGIANVYGGVTTLINTIVANSPSGGDLVGAVGSYSGNNDLIDDTSAGTNGSNGYFGASSFYVVAAGLDPNGLQNDGGPTQTIALLPGSPAINGGSNANAPATDQRGLPRIALGTIDIGAFEVQMATPSISATVGGTVVLGGGSKLTIASATLSGAYDATGLITFTLYDPDGNTLDRETVSVNGNGTYSPPNGSYLPTATGSYTWIAQYSGNSNNYGATAEQYESVVPAPVAFNGNATTNRETPVTINVLANDSDPNNYALTVQSVTSPGHGAAAVNADGSITYTPATNFQGTDTFQYSISDGHGGTATASVTVTVNYIVVRHCHRWTGLPDLGTWRVAGGNVLGSATGLLALTDAARRGCGPGHG